MIELFIDSDLALTEVRESDLENLAIYANNYEIYKNTLAIPYPYNIVDARHWYRIIEKESDPAGQMVIFAIRSRKTEELIGACGIEDIKRDFGNRAKIGYWLAEPFWNSGIMTRVIKRLCQYAFEDLNLHRVSATVFDFNKASCRVLEKCGFKKEGTLKKLYKKDDQYIDAILYARINPAVY
jgi:RimJ/RimL family protein N-acetyltransferase